MTIQSGPRRASGPFGCGLGRLLRKIGLAKRRHSRIVARLRRPQPGNVSLQRRQIGVAGLLLDQINLRIGLKQSLGGQGKGRTPAVVLFDGATGVIGNGDGVERRRPFRIEQRVQPFARRLPSERDFSRVDGEVRKRRERLPKAMSLHRLAHVALKRGRHVAAMRCDEPVGRSLHLGLQSVVCLAEIGAVVRQDWRTR